MCNFTVGFGPIKSYRQGRTKQKFNMLRRWIRRHFAYDWRTSSLGKHLTNWTSTEMCNYHGLIKSVADCLAPKKQLRLCHTTRANSKLNSPKVDIIVDKMKSLDYKNSKITAYLEIQGTRSFLRCEKCECSNKKEGRLDVKLFLSFLQTGKIVQAL